MNTHLDKLTRAFHIGQRVKIVDTENTLALVQQIIYSELGAQYQISYWHESVRRTEWVFPSEIENIGS